MTSDIGLLIYSHEGGQTPAGDEPVEEFMKQGMRAVHATGKFATKPACACICCCTMAAIQIKGTASTVYSLPHSFL